MELISFFEVISIGRSGEQDFSSDRLSYQLSNYASPRKQFELSVLIEALQLIKDLCTVLLKLIASKHGSKVLYALLDASITLDTVNHRYLPTGLTPRIGGASSLDETASLVPRPPRPAFFACSEAWERG